MQSKYCAWERKKLLKSKDIFMSNEVENKVPDLLVRRTIEQLQTYPKWSKKDYIKYYIKKILGKNPPKRNTFFWPHAMLAMGLAEYHWISMDQSALNVLQEYYSGWKKKGCPLHNVDDTMNGCALVYLNENIGGWDEEIDKIRDMILAHPLDKNGNLLYRKHCSDYVFVDTIGMVVPFLTEYYRIHPEDTKALELAEKQILNFLQNGMDEDTGLPYHGFDSQTGNKCGIIGWGRALGWLLLGMAYYVKNAENPNLEIVEQLKGILLKVCNYQREDGSFAWQITAQEGHEDTSATAMICYAMKIGLDRPEFNKSEQEKLEKSICNGVKSLYKNTKDGNVVNCSGECQGFGMYPQIYGTYPWAQGMALALLASSE